MTGFAYGRVFGTGNVRIMLVAYDPIKKIVTYVRVKGLLPHAPIGTMTVQLLADAWEEVLP